MGVAHAMKEQCGESAETLVCLGWKRTDAWTQRFRAGVPISDGELLTVEQIARSGCSTIVADQTLFDAVRAVDSSFDAIELAPVFDPLAVCAVSWSIAPVEPHTLVPMYPREPEAVRMWRDRAKA